MANQSPEQDLIDDFVAHLKKDSRDEFCPKDEFTNTNCKVKKWADVEFVSKSGKHWVIEAKSNDSKDAHNTVHKIFGELLKETGRKNRNNCSYGILIPKSGKEFYSRLFKSIKREKFIGFGQLIPVEAVFLSDSTGFEKFTWTELYDFYK